MPEKLTEYRRLPEIKQPTHHEESYFDPRQQRRVNWLVSNSVGTVLELGCSEGYILHRIRRLGCVGVDYDRERIEHGIKKYPGIRFYVLDVRYGLPFDDRAFDSVLVPELLEHMEFEQAKYVLEEAMRVARVKVLITMPFVGGPGFDRELVYTPDHRWHPDRASVARLLDGKAYTQNFFDGFIYVEVLK